MHLFISGNLLWHVWMIRDQQTCTGCYILYLTLISVVLGPSIVWVGSFMGSILECISYLRILISYLVYIYRHLLIFSIVLYRLRSYLVLNPFPVNLVILSQKQSEFGAQENDFHHLMLLQTIRQKLLFLSPANFHLIGCCFNSINNCLIASMNCCMHNSNN